MFKVRYTVYLTLVAALTALNTVCNAYLTIPTPVNGAAVSFTYIPCLIAGALLGPLAGLATGFTGDLIGALIRPLGPYNPIIGVASALLGFIPGLIFKELRLKRIHAGKADRLLSPIFRLSGRFKGNMPLLRSWAADSLRIFISFILTFIVCTASLNTYAMYIMYGMPKGTSFWAYFSVRLPWQLLIVAVNLVLCLVLFPLVKYAFERVYVKNRKPAGTEEPAQPPAGEAGTEDMPCADADV